MLGNDIKIGDIIEGSNCPTTGYNKVLFKVLELEICKDKNDKIYKFKITFARIEDCSIVRNTYLFPTIDNWRVVKTNGNTICKICKICKNCKN